MMLMHNDQVLETYRVGSCCPPNGHNSFEGDGRTPVGEYIIDRRNPTQSVHLFESYSYRNEAISPCRAPLCKAPAANISSTGRGPWASARPGDGEHGGACVAVSDRQMEDIYAMAETARRSLFLPWRISA